MSAPESHAATKPRLTPQDMKALAVIAGNLVDAVESRNPDYEHVTLKERAAFDSLRHNLDSLVRSRSNV